MHFGPSSKTSKNRLICNSLNTYNKSTNVIFFKELTLDFLSGHPTCENFSDGRMQPFTPNRYT